MLKQHRNPRKGLGYGTFRKMLQESSAKFDKDIARAERLIEENAKGLAEVKELFAENAKKSVETDREIAGYIKEMKVAPRNWTSRWAE
jgi:hypothetical protein